MKDEVRKAVFRHFRKEYFRRFPENLRRNGLRSAIMSLIRGQWSLVRNAYLVVRVQHFFSVLWLRIQGRHPETYDDVDL